MTTSSKLTIFEGPDGAGKSTLAQWFAKATGARYVHFSALPRVSTSLGRVYVEAMMPALLGYQDVVFDRSWLSEVPYGQAFREGADRLGDPSRAMLDRLALRCGGVVVMCDPGWETVRANFLARKHLEMLDDDNQLKIVYDLYRSERVGLPHLFYDYTMRTGEPLDVDHLVDELDAIRTPCHPLNANTAGNWKAELAIVGQDFGEIKDADAFYQWPFASFSKSGCCQWLTNLMCKSGVRATDAVWFNSDQDLSGLQFREVIIALGDVAEKRICEVGITPTVTIPHPQRWRRFNTNQRYPLFDALDAYWRHQ